MHHDASAFGTVVRTALTVILVILAWRMIVVPTLNDRFRQRLFELRRSLFLMVVHNKLSGNEAAYKQLRHTINGLLQFAERVTFMRALISNFSLPLNIMAYTERAEKAIAQIDDGSARRELLEHRERMGFEIIRHVIYTSPGLWLPLAVLLVATMSVAAAKMWLKKLSPTGIEAEADCFIGDATPA